MFHLLLWSHNHHSAISNYSNYSTDGLSFVHTYQWSLLVITAYFYNPWHSYSLKAVLSDLHTILRGPRRQIEIMKSNVTWLSLTLTLCAVGDSLLMYSFGVKIKTKIPVPRLCWGRRERGGFYKDKGLIIQEVLWWLPLKTVPKTKWRFEKKEELHCSIDSTCPPKQEILVTQIVLTMQLEVVQSI